MSAGDFELAMKNAINEQIRKAAEPIIKAAMDDIEKAMKEKVASIAVSMVSGEIDIYRDGKRLIVSIDINDMRR